MARLRGRGAAFAVAFAIATCLTGQISRAQDAPVVPGAILTINQDRLFAESQFGKATLEREQAERAAHAAENLRMEQELETEERDLTVRRATLPGEEFARLAEDFDRRAEDIRATRDAQASEIRERAEEDRRRFFRAVIPVLGELLTETGAVAIIDKGAIILSLSAIDVTDEAIKRVDAALGDGSTPDATTGP
ncbi:MAG: OmpH family outer membrane protein [Tabrizicola sp.]|nr:OmpH family outer membrane protein [Tabrizicola sp.]